MHTFLWTTLAFLNVSKGYCEGSTTQELLKLSLSLNPYYKFHLTNKAEKINDFIKSRLLHLFHSHIVAQLCIIELQLNQLSGLSLEEKKKKP